MTITRYSDHPMATAVPAFYVRPDAPARASVAGRLLAGAIALGSLTVLVVAATLVPSASGLGTHQALGLQRCDFLTRTGLPCPSCGMTTSFAHFADGNWPASVYVQPMGFALAVIAGMAVWGAAYVAISGRPAHRILRAVPGLAIVLPLLGLAVAAWAWKILIHVRGVDGWG